MNSIGLLLERQAEGYELSENDGNRLYVAVDGGGMASVVSLGALYQLGELGLLQYVDGFAGSSGGSLNSAYAMAGIALEARDIYTDFLPNNRFIRYTKPAVVLSIADQNIPLGKIPRPWVDMSVLGRAVKRELPLDTSALVSDERVLMIGASNLSKGRREYVKNHGLQDDPNQLIDYLLAGARMTPDAMPDYWPLKNGDIYADAALFWSTTDAIARRNEATHILNIASGSRPTRARSAQQGVVDWLQSRFAAKYSNYGPEAIRQMTIERDRVLGLFVVSDSIQVDGATIDRIYPATTNLPNRQTTDKHLLLAGFDAGRIAVLHALDRELISVAQ